MLVDYEKTTKAGGAWVLVGEDRLLGTLVLRPEGDHLSVETVAVRPDRQGRGLGRRLLAFAEEEARRSKLKEVRLYTNEKMWENIRFYEKLGFEETGRRTEEGYKRVFMRKRLGRDCVIRRGDRG